MSIIKAILLLIATMAIGIKLAAFRGIYSITTIEILLVSVMLFEVYVIIIRHRKTLCIIKKISKENCGEQSKTFNIVYEYADDSGHSYEVTKSVKKQPACIPGDKVYQYIDRKNSTIANITFGGIILIISAFLLVMTIW